MAGTNDRSKPFRGKKPIKDLREFKSKEIKKSLVHRARLRKNYFKLLEQEGEAPPQRPQDIEEEAGRTDEGEQELSDSDTSETQDGEEKHKKQTARRAGPLPPQRAPPPERRPKKPTNFAERSKMAKQRKDDQRLERLQKVTERREAVDKLNRQRERKKITLARRTKTGQPLMGPRINNLLDKIKQDMK